MAELVRESVAEYLARRPTTGCPGARSPCARHSRGAFDSGCPDLAEEHDRYLDEAFAS